MPKLVHLSTPGSFDDSNLDASRLLMICEADTRDDDEALTLDGDEDCKVDGVDGGCRSVDVGGSRVGDEFIDWINPLPELP